ncbi:MAG TPA: hypothetical protein VFR23_09730 [Jiangellaceae bacterium]|nr:hypothetical protein [Jiangellaceae bacterium]
MSDDVGCSRLVASTVLGTGPQRRRHDARAASASGNGVRVVSIGGTAGPAAVTAIGPDKLFELTTLVGYYSLLALQMNVFD